MRSNRFSLLVPVALVVVVAAACGNNHSSDSSTPIYLTESVSAPVADVDMSSTTSDVVIPSLSISSHAKSPTGTLGGQDDVILNLCVVTSQRSDGGTVASPQWRVATTIYVSAGGSASVTNFPIFPINYFSLPPLNQLFPQNGGVDTQTGNCNIRQNLQIVLYGNTVSGKAISLAFNNPVNFHYGQCT